MMKARHTLPWKTMLSKRSFLTEQPVTLCVLPLYHIYALNVTMGATMYCGGKIVMLPKFEPKSFIEALETYKPTFLHLAPPLLAFCADHDGVTPEMFSRVNYML